MKIYCDNSIGTCLIIRKYFKPLHLTILDLVHIYLPIVNHTTPYFYTLQTSYNILNSTI